MHNDIHILDLVITPKWSNCTPVMNLELVSKHHFASMYVRAVNPQAGSEFLPTRLLPSVTSLCPDPARSTSRACSRRHPCYHRSTRRRASQTSGSRIHVRNTSPTVACNFLRCCCWVHHHRGKLESRLEHYEAATVAAVAAVVAAATSGNRCCCRCLHPRHSISPQVDMWRPLADPCCNHGPPAIEELVFQSACDEIIKYIYIISVDLLITLHSKNVMPFIVMFQQTINKSIITRKGEFVFQMSFTTFLPSNVAGILAVIISTR